MDRDLDIPLRMRQIVRESIDDAALMYCIRATSKKVFPGLNEEWRASFEFLWQAKVMTRAYPYRGQDAVQR